MIKTLLKKQFAEMFRSYLYDAKKNKKRSKTSFVLYILLFAFLMIVVLGGIFTLLAVALCEPLKETGMGWLYFTLLGLLAVVLGAFGSVFNTYSGLYLAKDNDFLLSMPIPVGSIMTARLLGVYLMGLMYSAVVAIPAILVHQVLYPDVAVLASSFLWFIFVSVIVLTLSLALGYLVAKISLKLKNKSFVTVLISLVGIAAYYFFYFKAQTLIRDLLEHAALYGEQLKNAAYPLYVFGRAAEGDFAALGILLLAVGIVFVLLWILLSRSFIHIATSSAVVSKIKYKERKVKCKSEFAALFGKEMKRFTSSPNYILNCGMGILLLIALGIAILLKGNVVVSFITEVWGSAGQALVPVAFCAAVCLAAAMNDMAAPSVSLEGKNLWLVQSLPVSPLKVLKAKISVQLALTEVPALFCSVCTILALKLGFLESVLFLVNVCTVIAFMALVDLVCGIKMPNLTWTSEITPIKQSGAVLLAVLLHFLGTVIPPLGFVALSVIGGEFVAWLPMLLWSVLSLVLCLILYLWLVKRGARLFAEL